MTQQTARYNTRGAAYASLPETRTKTQKERILDALEKYGTLSNELVANVLGMRLSSVCGRMNELQKDGRIVPAGTGLSSAGVQVTFWKVKRYGTQTND